MTTILVVATVALLVGFFLGCLYFLNHYQNTAAYEEMDKSVRMQIQRITRRHIPTFSDAIQKISPSFCSIYDQAAIAESAQLQSVSGVGYGKALEFLIKDYAKQENPNDSEQIDRATLGACIKSFVNDPGIRESATLATWLRNDETHYVRKFLTKDIEDLKKIVNLTIGLIENAERRKALEQDVGTFGKDMRS